MAKTTKRSSKKTAKRGKTVKKAAKKKKVAKKAVKKVKKPKKVVKKAAVKKSVKKKAVKSVSKTNTKKSGKKVSVGSIKTKYKTFRIGELSKGSEQALEGKKVYFTIKSPPEQKGRGYTDFSFQAPREIIWANDRRIQKKMSALEEVRACGAEGALFYGEEILQRLEKGAMYMELLKKEFGENFHIHLVTPLKHATRLKFKRLNELGIDELHIQPDIAEKGEGTRLGFLTSFKGKKGVELPIIPGKEALTKNFIDRTKSIADFYHFQEARGDFDKKEMEEAKSIVLSHAKKTKLPIHHYSLEQKNRVELYNRMKQKAKNTAKNYDEVTTEGTLHRGAIYLNDYKPSFSYRLMLQRLHKKPLVKKLFKIKRNLQRELNIQFNFMDVDDDKLRILTASEVVRKHKEKLKKMKLVPAIVEELPTHNKMEVEVEFL